MQLSKMINFLSVIYKNIFFVMNMILCQDLEEEKLSTPLPHFYCLNFETKY